VGIMPEKRIAIGVAHRDLRKGQFESDLGQPNGPQGACLLLVYGLRPGVKPVEIQFEITSLDKQAHIANHGFRA
jgi:hypothetical protein